MIQDCNKFIIVYYRINNNDKTFKANIVLASKGFGSGVGSEKIQ